MCIVCIIMAKLCTVLYPLLPSTSSSIRTSCVNGCAFSVLLLFCFCHSQHEQLADVAAHCSANALCLIIIFMQHASHCVCNERTITFAFVRSNAVGKRATGFRCHYHRIETSMLFSLPHLRAHTAHSVSRRVESRLECLRLIKYVMKIVDSYNERKWKLKPQWEMTHMKNVIAWTVISHLQPQPKQQ